MATQVFTFSVQLVLLGLLACAHSEITRLTKSGVFCADTKPSLTPPSSVHSLRPGDVSVVSALGLTASQRSKEITALNGLSEILSTFNPALTTLLPEKRSLLDEIDHLVPSLSNDQWKLLLLFVHVDDLCICSDQDSAAISSAVQTVEKALDTLHTKLDRTLVHVVVWGEKDPDVQSGARACKCAQDEEGTKTWRRYRRATFMTVLQESLKALLQKHKYWNVQNEFTVVLQSTPTLIETSTKTVTELWTKLLQPMAFESASPNFPCPTKEKPYLNTHRNSPTPQPPKAEPQPTPMMGSTLPCFDRNPSPTVPTSVHELRPADIKVVAALGDSITAANGVGAGNLLEVTVEYRGLSWSIGGNGNLTTVTTLANILREFNPSLTGFSTGVGPVSLDRSFLNQAVPGAKADDMEGQAIELIKRMKNDSRIDFENDWKVITIFIGGNDLCAYCGSQNDLEYHSAKNYIQRIQNALDLFQKEVPRAMVNLVEILYILPLRELHRNATVGCPTWLVNMMCDCVIQPEDGSPELKALEEVNREYQLETRKLVNSGRYNTSPNFTVVLQPFFRNITIPRLLDGRPDRSYFTPDCFHLSQKSHVYMAQALWNNMLEPSDRKSTNADFEAGISLKCPSAKLPYFSTSENGIPEWGSDFSCTHTAPSDSVPTSVHKLRPGDIKVVASLGDSLTAGFGAKAESLIQLPIEDRGVSWSIGGDETLETVTTVPNILKKFNPHVFGFSKGSSGRPNGFNMAVSGAKANGIPGQVRDLVEALKTNTNVSFEQDWKMVTLFIGGNDLCQYCNDKDSLSPKMYIQHIRDALDILYNEVPRVLVNFVEVLEIEGLRKVTSNTVGCKLLQPNLCSCFLKPHENSDELSEMKRFNRQLQTETERLVYGGRYDGREDFTVVVQPFLQNSVVPMGEDRQPDLSYFSVDCFHFSERGHSEMAVNLWNNMLEPVGSKQVYNNFTRNRMKIRCPTEEHPYIFTQVNSLPPQTTKPPVTTPVEATPPAPKEEDSMASWAAAVLAIAGLLIGSFVTWLVLYCRARSQKKKKRKDSGSMKKASQL